MDARKQLFLILLVVAYTHTSHGQEQGKPNTCMILLILCIVNGTEGDCVSRDVFDRLTAKLELIDELDVWQTTTLDIIKKSLLEKQGKQ